MFILFFFNDTATTEIYTLSLHDALPICWLLLTRPLSLAFRWGALQHGLRNTAQDVDFLGGQLRAVEKLVEARHQLLGRGRIEKADMRQRLQIGRASCRGRG